MTPNLVIHIIFNLPAEMQPKPASEAAWCQRLQQV
jgi:hypothetical protein